MTIMTQIEFQVGAKAARLIGRENIADVDGALIELIKNAYDADATCVWVDFYMPFPDIPDKAPVSRFVEQLSEEELQFASECYDEEKRFWKKKKDLPEEHQNRLRNILFSHNRIIVADNGCGMSADIVRSAWMYIGTSNKEYDIKSEKGRTKTGAKGIGRFALDKLSKESTMYTRAAASTQTVRWNMNWEQFANAKLISEVKAQLGEQPDEYLNVVKGMLGEDCPAFKEHDWSTGTVIVLNPVREAWSERLFKKVNTNLKSINPIGSVDRFEVTVKNHFYPDYHYKTEKVAIDPDDYDYRIKAAYDGKETLSIKLLRNEVDLTKKSVVIEKYGQSTRKSLDEFWARKKLQTDGYRKEDYREELVFNRNVQDILPTDSLEKIKRVGIFEAELYFLRNTNSGSPAIIKRAAAGRRKKLLGQFSGVKLYRDEFKVRPYGDEGSMYDWLGMGERVQKSPAAVSAQRGAWRVRSNQMIGWVKIGRESNPYLEDMANREGIALTDTYYIFVSLLQECLKVFEFDRQYIYREYARWTEEIEERLSEYAEKVMAEAARRAAEAAQRAAETASSEKERQQAEQQQEEHKQPEQGQNEDYEQEQDQQREQEKNQESDTGEERTDSPDQGGRKSGFTEDEMFGTVYKLMQKSDKELKSKQIQQILSSSGVIINTFFHEFSAMNTQFHVQAPQIRSRVNYILKGKEYEGLPAYNPYTRIDTLEKNDRITAAFLDVVMDGLKKDSLNLKEESLRKLIVEILDKWSLLLADKNISINPEIFEETDMEDFMRIALVDLYMILNNFILNSAWFLERSHNPKREISFQIIKEQNQLYLTMENNGPPLPEQYRDNPDMIFELGETSKEGGTGLGLWVVKEAVERNNGTISVMNKEEGFGLEIIWSRPERRI